MNKICTCDEAVSAIKDGVSVAAHVWGLCGTPDYLLRALAGSAATNLTFYCTNFLPPPPILAGSGYPDPTILLPQIKKVITPFMGGRAFNRHGMGGNFLDDRIHSGQLETEATTHGVLLERLHAGAMGLGGFYSPIGLGTIVCKGKEVKTINGKEYIFETPICPDVGLIKADKADKLGNLVYRGSARGANPIIALASKLTIVEVNEIVETGELDPDQIVTPGIYVDYIVKIPQDDISSTRRRKELVRKMVKLMNS